MQSTFSLCGTHETVSHSPTYNILGQIKNMNLLYLLPPTRITKGQSLNPKAIIILDDLERPMRKLQVTHSTHCMQKDCATDSFNRASDFSLWEVAGSADDPTSVVLAVEWPFQDLKQTLIVIGMGKRRKNARKSRAHIRSRRTLMSKYPHFIIKYSQLDKTYAFHSRRLRWKQMLR